MPDFRGICVGGSVICASEMHHQETKMPDTGCRAGSLLTEQNAVTKMQSSACAKHAHIAMRQLVRVIWNAIAKKWGWVQLHMPSTNLF
jgi:hypothetical protein